MFSPSSKSQLPRYAVSGVDEVEGGTEVDVGHEKSPFRWCLWWVGWLGRVGCVVVQDSAERVVEVVVVLRCAVIDGDGPRG